MEKPGGGHQAALWSNTFVHLLAAVDHHFNVIRGILPDILPIIVVTLADGFLVVICLKVLVSRQTDANGSRLPKYFSHWRWLSVGLLTLGLVSFVIVVFPVPSIQSATGPVVVADIDNQTGETDLPVAGLKKALLVALEQSERVSILPTQRMQDALERMMSPPNQKITLGVGREVCRREGVGPLIAVKVVRKNNESTLVDGIGQLSVSLRRKMEDPLVSVVGSKPLAKVTTASTEALQEYSEAEDLLRSTQYDAAERKLENAWKLDPNFAMALAELATLNELRSHFSEAKGYEERAYKSRDHLTEPEKVRVDELYSYYVLGNPQQAFDEVNEFIRRNPANRSRLGTLSYLATQLMNFDTAEEAMQTFLGRPPWGKSLAEDVEGLWLTQLCLDKFSDAVETEKDLRERYPEFPASAYLAAVSSLGLGDMKAVNTEIARVQASGDQRTALWLTGLRDLYWGKLQSARLHWEEYLATIADGSSPDWLPNKDLTHLHLARIAFLEKNSAELFQQLDSVHEVDDEFLAEVGKYYARTGKLREAEDVETHLIIRLGDSPKYHKRALLQFLDGEIALASGNTQKSIQLLSSAASYPWRNLFCQVHESLANAAMSSHQFDLALEHYNAILQHKGVALSRDRPDEWILAFYGLGITEESRGNTKVGLTYYSQFLDFWHEGDPNVPALSDAKERASRLKQQY